MAKEADQSLLYLFVGWANNSARFASIAIADDALSADSCLLLIPVSRTASSSSSKQNKQNSKERAPMQAQLADV